MTIRPSRHAVTAAVVATLLLGCKSNVQQNFTAPDEVEDWSEYQDSVLKLHMKDGSLYTFQRWRVTETREPAIAGMAKYWSVDRETSYPVEARVPLEEVAIAETDEVHRQHALIAAIAITTVATAAIGVVCLTVDKACFGSCPTFYVEEGESRRLVAEGFSHAIAPALEATDVDSLTGWHPRERQTTLTMTNEAMETHVLRHVRLLAAPLGGYPEAYRLSDDTFRPGRVVGVLRNCFSEEGRCLSSLATLDGNERYTPADERDLSAKEAVVLVFDDVPTGNLGLAVTFRQSFMTTYLLYQWLAYLGRNAPRVLGQLDDAVIRIEEGIAARLGALEFDVEVDGDWQFAGSVNETGPLASETRALLLPRDSTAGTVRIRMRGTKGYWRVDHVALVELGEPVEPVGIEVRSVTDRGDVRPEVARDLHSDSSAQTVTFGGDRLDLTFELPPNPHSYGYFLESRGYYLEWMRSSWLDEEDDAMAAMMMFMPKTALRKLAPAFKEIEPRIEDVFWNSRYQPDAQ